MQLDDSFFLPKFKNILTTEEDLCEFIKKLFPDLIIIQNQGSCFKALIMLLLHLTGPISMSALEMYLGTFLTQNSSRAKIGRFVKKGNLLSYPIRGTDMNSKMLYGISQAENHLLHSYVLELQTNAYVRKKGNIPMHAYGTGLSTLNLMQLSIPFIYYDQVKYTSTSPKFSIIVDRLIEFNTSTTWTLYLEQDMGTERLKILDEKIAFYGHCIATNHKDHLVFSSHAIIPNNMSNNNSNEETHKSDTDILVSYIKQQYNIAKKKFKKLCSLTKKHFFYPELAYYYKRISSGGTIFMIPSVMLNNYYEYFCFQDSGLLKRVETLIKTYFSSSSDISYSPLSDYYYMHDKLPSIHFRNCFRIRQDTVVCVEHIGIDVGGFLRAAYLVSSTKTPKEKIILICLCDSEDDATFFCKETDYNPEKQGIYIFFVYTADLNQPYNLRCIKKNMNDYILSEPLRPM